MGWEYSSCTVLLVHEVWGPRPLPLLLCLLRGILSVTDALVSLKHV
jgi:hypothetical protein